MTKVLIATLGLSPGVVTGAYFALAREGHEIDRVVTVTTDHILADQCEALIDQTFSDLKEAPLYEKLRPVKHADLGQALITYQLSQSILALLSKQDEAGEIFLVLTGGRTSMAAALMLALQKYLLDQPEAVDKVHLYHLEVLPNTHKNLFYIDLDGGGLVDKLVSMPEEEREIYLDPPGDSVSLIEVPVFLSSVHEITHHLVYATGFYLSEHEQDCKTPRFFYRSDKWPQDVKKAGVFVEKRDIGPGVILEAEERPFFRRMICEAFSLRELKELCFDLNVFYEDIPGETLTEKAHELISYFLRRRDLPRLLKICQERRSNFNWDKAVKYQEHVSYLLCDCTWLENGQNLDPKVVNNLQQKVAAVQEETLRPVAGWVVSNTPYADQAAMNLAEQSGISLYQAVLPDNWKKRVDWQISALQPMTPAPE